MPGAITFTLERVVGGVPSPLSSTAQAPTAESLAASAPVVGALTAVGEVLTEFVRGRFDAQADPWGKAWAPLSSATIAARARRLGVRMTVGGHRRGSARNIARAATMTILVDRAVLRNGIVAAVERLSVTVGVGGAASKYARSQQFGLPAGRRWGRNTVGALPARPYFPLRPDGTPDLPAVLRDEIFATLQDALMFVLREAVT